MATRRTGYAGMLCIVMHGALALAWPAPASAQARDRWSGSVAVTTDYIYRGISQTRGAPALQGTLQMQSPAGWSAGVRGSTVRFARDFGPTHEIDLHAARAWSVGADWSAQLGFIHYEYPDDAGVDYDYDELTASVSYQQRITASIAWSPNTSRYSNGVVIEDRPAVSYELTVLQPLAPRWFAYAGAGHYDLRELFGTGYWFWNAGVAFTWDAVQVDFMHIDTDATADRLFGYPASGTHWIAALSWRF